VDHDVHRMRRALEAFFSPANVKSLGPMLKQLVYRLCERLEEEGRNGAVRIKLGFACYATDGITTYAMGKSVAAT
jgi:cytochrome P450